MITSRISTVTAILLSCTGWFIVLATPAWADEDNPALLWGDFNHYVRIARPDLADAAGTALISKVQNEQLLDIVEASEYRDYDQTLLRAMRMDPKVAETARQLSEMIRQAQIGRSREPARIRADIQRLDDGMRANLNAIERLKAAGQHACPYLLEVLLDDRQAKLHAYVLGAFVAIGRPMTYPLSVALPRLEPVQMGQIARVLAEIGYPEAMPYLKQVLESGKADEGVTLAVQSAYDRLAEESHLSQSLPASELFLMLGDKYYTTATRQELMADVDPETGMGIVWEYTPEAGLVAIPVPGGIYGDVLAMQAAKQALVLDPQLDSALSLWLAANLRRENRLPAGAEDKSYSSAMHSPEFYLQMAGPLRQHDVLNKALDDEDADLALDSIRALMATAGTEAMLNQEGMVQPLLRALTYSDRRVRFSAALAIAHAHPDFEFAGSHRVVPVLAEALRQSDLRYALVLGQNQETLNVLTSAMQRLGFQTHAGLTLDELADEVNLSPGIDLIVVEQPVEQVEVLQRQTQVNYKLANVPIVAVVSLGVQVELTTKLASEKRVHSVVKSPDQHELYSVIEESIKPYISNPFSSEEAERYATASLQMLRKVAANKGTVFDVTDAQPALIEALTDKRREIATAAAGVLAMIGDPAGQQAICEAALDVIRPANTRVGMLESLAESAATFGNHLNENQLIKLLELVKTSGGDMAVAAAKAHGALTLPTSNVVEMIVK